MAVEPATLRFVMSHFATGVAVITGMDGDEPVGLTVQSLVSVSLDPPLLLFCPQRTSASWPRIAPRGVFAANILHADQREACDRFAASGGRKFEGIRWWPGRCGAPLLAGALAYAECSVEAIHEAGDHHVVIGQVMESGAIRPGEPLLYYRGCFAALAS
ncbi:MAG TPA: flavin reductase family protein [Trebonia sp.]|jgi:3-hydroxy-9,10-secoandrosta-1,3,5(10)-triene-9,17-dione monooxygenase reductase component|nr:flavin reductase family protein [Trebonia sp.]